MGYNQSTRQTQLVGGIRYTEGNIDIRKFKSGTVAVDPASLAALTKVGITVTLTGVAVGDLVVLEPPSDLEDDLIPAGVVVTDDDEITVFLYNPSDAPVDGASKNWRYYWWDLT